MSGPELIQWGETCGRGDYYLEPHFHPSKNMYGIAASEKDIHRTFQMCILYTVITSWATTPIPEPHLMTQVACRVLFETQESKYRCAWKHSSLCIVPRATFSSDHGERFRPGGVSTTFSKNTRPLTKLTFRPPGLKVAFNI